MLRHYIILLWYFPVLPALLHLMKDALGLPRIELRIPFSMRLKCKYLECEDSSKCRIDREIKENRMRFNERLHFFDINIFGILHGMSSVLNATQILFARGGATKHVDCCTRIKHNGRRGSKTATQFTDGLA
jgi:hypothetical protein